MCVVLDAGLVELEVRKWVLWAGGPACFNIWDPGHVNHGTLSPECKTWCLHQAVNLFCYVELAGFCPWHRQWLGKDSHNFRRGCLSGYFPWFSRYHVKVTWRTIAFNGFLYKLPVFTTKIPFPRSSQPPQFSICLLLLPCGIVVIVADETRLHLNLATQGCFVVTLI